MLTEAVVAADTAFQIVVSQYRVGTVVFNRLATIETKPRDAAGFPRPRPAVRSPWAWSRLTRAEGGGWEIRLGQPAASASPAPAPLPAGTEIAPIPEPKPNPRPVPGNAEPPAPLPPPRAKPE